MPLPMLKRTAKDFKTGMDLRGLRFSDDQLTASICRASFIDFVMEFWHVVSASIPHWNWHIKYLCDLVQKAAERAFRGEPKAWDLCVNVPPGTTKSTIFSVMLPAWCWTRRPDFGFIGASYSEKLAMDLSIKCRDVVRSDKYQRLFPDVVWRDDQDTKSYFRNTRGGFRYAVGVNGTVTGLHADILVIDDPLDPEQSYSSLEMATSNRWIKETLSSRKRDKRVAFTVLVMQRLHQDDPTADFLKNKKTKHVRLPAELSKDIPPVPAELEQNYKDGLLDPVRLSKEVLDEERMKGEYYYAAQFMQVPVPLGGGMFKTQNLKTGTPPGKYRKVVRFWDQAGSYASGAYTVGVKMAEDLAGTFWVLDVFRDRLDAYERQRQMRLTAEADGADVWIGVEQEPGSGGKHSAEEAVKNLAGFRVQIVKSDKSTGGKEVRAEPYAAQVNGNNVRVVEAPWNKPYEDELRHFPNSKYKDQVDASSGAFLMLRRRKIRVGPLRGRK